MRGRRRFRHGKRIAKEARIMMELDDKVRTALVQRSDDPAYWHVDPDVQFTDVWQAINDGDDVYDLLDAGSGWVGNDVREQVFDLLSEILGIDYDIVYWKWLNPGVPLRDAYGMDGSVKLALLERGSEPSYAHIAGDITFEDVHKCMESGGDLHRLVDDGSGLCLDSRVREAILSALDERLGLRQ